LPFTKTKRGSRRKELEALRTTSPSSSQGKREKNTTEREKREIVTGRSMRGSWQMEWSGAEKDTQEVHFYGQGRASGHILKKTG